ncbi:MAG TPA: T9SS type A sorting domain-containing protein [Flavobacterium sp.]|nr:T9SS type A sorting domain-containing protein [Flavobacterium sp.]
MKNFTLLLLFLFATSITNSQNLILNPSAEEPMVNGEIPFWTETIGNKWISYDNIVDFNFEANTVPHGTFWFYAQNEVQNINGQNVSELEQTINISSDANDIDLGSKNYFFNGFVRTFEQGTNDQSNIFIQFFDANNLLLNEFSFGPFSDASVWSNVNGTLLAPVNSRIIKIKLHSIRRTGVYNDAIYDNLYLGSVPLLNISENTIAKFRINMYPNPTTGIVTISNEENLSIDKIEILDILGKRVATKTGNTSQVDISHLSNGMYVFKIYSGIDVLAKKIIKQ